MAGKLCDALLGIPGPGILQFQVLTKAISGEFPALFPANFRHTQRLVQRKLGLMTIRMLLLMLGDKLLPNLLNLFI
jgi:hypothetical protein